MPRNKQSVSTLKKHLTNDEIKSREEQEEHLKEFPSDKIRPPNWLTKEDKKIFKQLVDNFKSVGLLANVDVHLLAVLSNTISRYKMNAEKLTDDNILVEYTNKFGATNLIENPLISNMRKDFEIIYKLSSKFGLSPADRLKLVSIDTPKEEDEFDRDFG